MKGNKNEFTKEMLSDTLKYQKQYRFKLGENNSAHNNEGDAFRHTYMQSIMANRYGTLSAKTVSSGHEFIGKIKGQDLREYNMDMWNNQQGQQIYNEIRREYPNFNKLSEQQQKDIIAGKVVQRMREGKLITDINDARQYNNLNIPYTPTRGIGGVKNNGQPLGFAVPIETPQSRFFGYANPLTDNNRIFTREEVGAMSPDEFSKYEKEIDAQIKACVLR